MAIFRLIIYNQLKCNIFIQFVSTWFISKDIRRILVLTFHVAELPMTWHLTEKREKEIQKKRMLTQK